MAQKKNPQDKAAAAAKREARRARTERTKIAAEERRKAQKRKEQMTLLGVVAGVLVLVVGGFFFVRSLGSDKPDTAPAGASGDFGLLIGEPDAPKSVVIYEDFLCPFCGQLEQTVGERLDGAVEAGEIKVEYRPLGFLERISDYSPRSANAFAVVLDASGPEVAKEFHDLLYADQPAESGPFPDDDDLVALAVKAGAEEADVRPGVEDLAFEGWVNAANEAASQEGINSTPSVFVDGKLVEGEGLTVNDVAEAIVGTSG